MRMTTATIPVCVVLLACGSTASGAAFTNGSFDMGTAPGVFITLAAGSTAITGWTVVAGTIDYIGTYWMDSDGGGRSLDMSGNGPGAIRQTFDTNTNHLYQVMFDIAGNPDGAPVTKHLQASVLGDSPSSVEMDFNFTFDTTGKTRPNGMGWTTRFFNFVSDDSGATGLTFRSLDNTAFGPALDNVRITDFGAAPIPEPASFVLLGTALASLALLRRRQTAHTRQH
jgi:choice-of-anchor C domain-containing protein